MYLVKLGELLVLEIQRLEVSCCSHWENSCLFEIAALQSKKSHIKFNPTLPYVPWFWTVLDEVTQNHCMNAKKCLGYRIQQSGIINLDQCQT